jgi:hypothetical protein
MMLFTAGMSTRQESVDAPRKTVTSTRGMKSTALFALAVTAAAAVVFLVTLLPSQGARRIDVTTSSFIEQQPEVSLYSPKFEKMEHEYYPPSAS